MHWSARKDDLDETKFLVEKGADINFANEVGDTPLHYAFYRSKLDAVRFLIEKGGNVSARNQDDKIPLDFAVEKFYPLIPIDYKGSTQLHYAVDLGNVQLVKKLLKRVNFRDLHNFILRKTTEGNTALDLARSAGHKNITEILNEALQEKHHTPA